MERQIITVDIAPGYNKVERLKSSQGDIGRPLGVYITQNGTALDCSAYTADLYILKPDGNFFTGTVTVDATEHNLITWDTAEQETPVAGECAAQIRILNNGDDIGTARFVEYVEASPGFCGEASESVVESLMEYVRRAAASAETASGAASSASGSASAASGSASAAASSASAAAGSASTAHTDAETASQAAQTAQDVADSIPEDYSTLSDDVTGLKSAIDNNMSYIVGKTNLLSEDIWNVGAYISQTGVITPYATAKYTNLIPVHGEKLVYHYKASTTNGTTRIHGYDSNGDWVEQIASYATGTSVTEKEYDFLVTGYSFIRISESTTITPIVLIESGSINEQIQSTEDRITSLEINPQNLIGMQKDKYYPVNPPIKAGDSITVCVANNEQIGSACDVILYDSEKTQIQSFRLYRDNTSRTVIVNSDVSYIKLGMYPAKLLSIVRGTETKQYSPPAYDYNQYAACIQIADDYYKQRIKYPDYFVNNFYVSATNHLISESLNYVSTNPIPLNKGDVLHYNLCTSGSALISLYDKKTGAYISSPVVGNSGDGVMTKGTYTLEQDAYVIASHRPFGVMYDSKSYFYVNNSVFRKADISANTSDILSGTFVSGYGTLDGWESNAIAFSKLMIDTEKAEAFLYFTDSHFMSKTGGAWKPYIHEVFSYIEKLYYSTPCSFVLHGGDWLGSGESREDYMYKLASIGGAFRRNFDRYALVVGNHETAGQSAEQTRLTHDTLTNTLMSRFGRCYYTFNANTFKMYCFDTWDSGALDDYGKTQLNWFANALTNETESHIVIAMHILYDEQNLRPMGEQISLCAEAYNNRGSFTYDGVTYNYSNATGKVAFIIAGHEHGDRTGTVNNIPFILTVNTTGYGGEGNFDLLPLPLDLIKVDWTNSLLTAYRARRDAAGTTRTLQIIT